MLFNLEQGPRGSPSSWKAQPTLGRCSAAARTLFPWPQSWPPSFFYLLPPTRALPQFTTLSQGPWRRGCQDKHPSSSDWSPTTVSTSPSWPPVTACPCGADTATLGTTSPKALEVLLLPASSLLRLLLSEGHALLLSSRCSPPPPAHRPSPSAQTYRLKLPDPHTPPSKPVHLPSLCPSGLALSWLTGANEPYRLRMLNKAPGPRGPNWAPFCLKVCGSRSPGLH